MGQHKFEKQIGRQLRDREIKPQAGSWEQLSSRLEKEDKKSISLFFIAGIAASITAAILIFSLTFNNEPQSAPQVVDSPSKTIEEAGEKEPEVLQQIAAEEVEAPEEPVRKQPPVATKHQPSAIMPQKVENSPDIKTALVQESNVEPVVEETAEVSKSELLEGIMPARLEEVIAEVSARAGENEDLSESEVDALLYKAASEISANRERREFTGKVDATALLMDVEMELDQTFREKVFDILKDSYLKARTAVANRSF